MKKDILTISFVMQKNEKNILKKSGIPKKSSIRIAIFKSMFDHFSTLRKKWLNCNIQGYYNGIISIILCKTLTFEI